MRNELKPRLKPVIANYFFGFNRSRSFHLKRFYHWEHSIFLYCGASCVSIWSRTSNCLPLLQLGTFIAGQLTGVCIFWSIRLSTARKVSIFGVIQVRIFPHSDWTRRDTESDIQSECGKIRTRITPNTDVFYTGWVWVVVLSVSAKQHAK